MEADTLMGNAAVMHVTDGSWTIGTGNYDGINYGLWYDDVQLARVALLHAQAAQKLGVKKIVVEHLGVDEGKVTDNASFVDDLGGEGNEIGHGGFPVALSTASNAA